MSEVDISHSADTIDSSVPSPPTPAEAKPFRVFIPAIGSRGDLQPTFLLGAALRKMYGWDITVATAQDYQKLAESYDLKWTLIGPNIVQLLNSSQKGFEFQEVGTDFGRAMRLFDELLGPHLRTWFDNIAGGCKDADLVIMSPVCYYLGYTVAEMYPKLIMCMINPLPAAPTKYFPPPSPQLGDDSCIKCINKIKWNIMLGYFGKPWAPCVDKVRIELNLPPVTVTPGEWLEKIGRKVFKFHTYSNFMVSPPIDWPETDVMPGSFFEDEIIDKPFEPPSPLVEFLKAGPPVYIGVGSLAHSLAKDLTLIEKYSRVWYNALEQTGLRAIIAKAGVPGEFPEFITKNPKIFVIEDAPHNWLFPQVSCVVSHCGAGSLAYAVRAGKPVIGIPFGYDQPWNGERAVRAGVCPGYKHVSEVTTPWLVEMLNKALKDPQFLANAQRIGRLMATERGLEKSAQLTKDWVEREQKSLKIVQ